MMYEIVHHHLAIVVVVEKCISPCVKQIASLGKGWFTAAARAVPPNMDSAENTALVERFIINSITSCRNEDEDWDDMISDDDGKI